LLQENVCASPSWAQVQMSAGRPLMFFDLCPGNIAEPLSGRAWDRRTIMEQVWARVERYRSQGMTAGDRVFLLHGNTIEFFADLCAVWSLGGCAIPIDSRLTQYEVETLTRTAAPRFALAQETLNGGIVSGLLARNVEVLESSGILKVRAAVPGAPFSTDLLSLDDPALILFTSGTTGQPKGVVHTHRSLRARWMSLRQSLGVEKFRRTLCLLPTHFGHGLICNCLFPWLSGQDLFILPPFRPDLLMQLGEILDDQQITFFSSVPTVWRLALKTARRPRSASVERVFCGSAPLSATLWRGIQEWTGSGEVMNAYGITETGSWVAGTTIPEFTAEDGLIGEAWGAVIRILKTADTSLPPALAEQAAPGEAGFIWINTPALMQGYFGRDDLTRKVVAQGWFLTGDIGLADERGYLFLRGRTREEINKGGSKIFPGDIDAVAEQFGGTIDVCSFGYEDPLYGENVGIAVVLTEPRMPTLRALHEWVSARLAKHQIPQQWYALESIPRTSRGKINREQVAAECVWRKPVDLRNVLAGTGD
jgi:acyl-CoA synthetase (AMP-forming)/AMP-acid ligase II